MSVGCPNGKRLFSVSGFVMRSYCDQWSCPVCRKRLAHKWAQNVAYGWALWRPRPFYFQTLTMPGWMSDPAQGYRELPKCWDNWRKQAQRKFGWYVYAAFAEEQSANRAMVHLHIITLTTMPTRLNDLAVNAGFGPQSKNELMTGINCAWYVTKYASKSLPHAPAHFRRVRVSSYWPRLPDPYLPQDYIPQGPRESTREYLHRCAQYFGFTPLQMLERWENEAIDIGTL
jgi:hypothetical protein